MDEDKVFALLAEVDKLEADEDTWTWLDSDPSVAWNDEDSYHGKLAAIYREAGWESCYHRDGARFHFNVKLNGNEAYRGIQDTIKAAELFDNEAYDAVMERVNGIQNFDMEIWWQDGDVEAFLWDEGFKRSGAIKRSENGPRYWSCGRSGGYFNCPDLEDNGRMMVKLAHVLEQSRGYYNSRGYGEDLATRAIEDYREFRLADMASGRPDRIEA